MDMARSVDKKVSVQGSSRQVTLPPNRATNPRTKKTVTGAQMKKRAQGALRPCEKLRMLRDRSGLSAERLAAECGLRARTSWFRYEDVKKMGDRLIPYPIIEKAIPVLVGRGLPAITRDELIEISEARNLSDVMKTEGQRRHSTDNEDDEVFLASARQNVARLPVRCNAQRGTFIEGTNVSRETVLEFAPIAGARNEWAAKVTDGHAAPLFSLGTYLHVEDVTAALTPGTKVIAVVQRTGTPFGEVLVGEYAGPSRVIPADGRAAVPASIVGRVVGSYTKL